MKKLLGSYFKLHIKSIIMFLINFFICVVVFYLNREKTDVVLYAFELCGIIGLLYTCVDFYLFYRKHMALVIALKEIDISIDRLPVPADLLEEDYQNLITNLFELRNSLELQKAIDDKDMIDYYTMWAHQIKTPIAAMSILLQSKEGEGYKDLRVELFKIEQYVEMVLSYLRLDTMNSDLKLEKILLDEVLKSAIRKYSTVFIAKKLKLVFNDTNAIVLTDKKWLSFVVEQILSNAIKYTANGTISIYVQNKDILVIEDTGIGIQEEDLPRVFERGFTGYNGRNYKKSTGLGLYLCKKVLDKLSHKIKIESKPAFGTKVKIDLSSDETIKE
ncbi:sensor histidine kinase [Anaerosacchariphilus polymeriproducens]|uniref:histidine kinase n=1 Tax=Anaerosacchariphilus polymeriproducens TaxID=1812858 RepID=A0A371AXN9_9FIRM|nr:sensor histidine kinase [Anaerosacchariphilus polymeriproducens]RDU24250.1 sensor histidine kinase [Anaerosacchariphilus polymeriproducens]